MGSILFPEFPELIKDSSISLLTSQLINKNLSIYFGRKFDW